MRQYTVVSVKRRLGDGAASHYGFGVGSFFIFIFRLYRTEAGLELHMATNYLGCFLLCQGRI
jgi:hypothetical protein